MEIALQSKTLLLKVLSTYVMVLSTWLDLEYLGKTFWCVCDNVSRADNWLGKTYPLKWAARAISSRPDPRKSVPLPVSFTDAAIRLWNSSAFQVRHNTKTLLQGSPRLLMPDWAYQGIQPYKLSSYQVFYPPTCRQPSLDCSVLSL